MTLEEAAKKIEALKCEILFDEDFSDDNLCPVAQALFISITSTLGVAHGLALQAQYHQARAIAEKGWGNLE